MQEMLKAIDQELIDARMRHQVARTEQQRREAMHLVSVLVRLKRLAIAPQGGAPCGPKG